MNKKIAQYDEAYDIINGIPDFYIEMSKEEAGVLSGVIKEYKPKKIVEIGVAAGGSTCNILKTLELLGLTDTDVISLDLNNFYYRNKEKETGFLLKENSNCFSNYNKHTFFTGKLAVDRLEKIGGEIDLLFLDTVHLIPGEILDFLLLLPYLSKDAIVVLHDTNMHNLTQSRNATSNRVLLSCVTADKFYREDILNIGVFKINEDTNKYIADVFSALLLPWEYHIDNEVLEKYVNEYRKHYEQSLIDIMEAAVQEAVNVQKANDFLDELKKLFKNNSEVYIYGCGFLGSKLYAYIRKNGYKISGMIVSDGVNKEDFQFEEGVYHFSEIEKRQEKATIIVATIAKEVEELLAEKNMKYISYDETAWRYI